MEPSKNKPVDLAEAQRDETIPVCPHCFTPFGETQYYCAHCGESVGQLTGYIPFVNIRFATNFYGRLWRRAWFGKGAGLGTRILCLLVVSLAAPLMFVGLPFVLWDYMRKRRSEKAA